MTTEGKTFAVAVICADGRLHHEESRMNEQLRGILGVDFVDVVSIPGPDGCLKAGSPEIEVDARRVKMLVELHQAVAIAVVSHCNCGGHPVSDAQHKEDACAGARELADRIRVERPVYAGIFHYESDTDWRLELLENVADAMEQVA